MTDRTADTSDACHVKPPRFCMGCNADLTGTYATRLFCDPCNERRDRQRSAAAKRRAYAARRASGEPRNVGGAKAKSKHCHNCERMPWARPVGGNCPGCGLPWAAEMNVRQAPTPGAWVWL